MFERVFEVAESARDEPASGDRLASKGPYTPLDQYDLVVVGSGSAAREAAALGRRWGATVALVGAGAEAGRARAEAAARRARLAEVARRLFDSVGTPRARPGSSGGSHDGTPPTDWDDDLCEVAFKEEFFDRAELFRAEVQAPLEAGNEADLRELREVGVVTYSGGAEFVGRDALLAGETMLRFRRAIVALEAVAAPLSLPVLEEVLPLSDETLARLENLPRQIAVVGADAEACAWAQIFTRFGSEVHLVSTVPSLLPENDPEAAALVFDQLAAERVRLHLGCTDLRLGKMGQRKTLVIDCGGRREMLMVDEILGGRQKRLALDDLKLDAADVTYNTAGIVADEHLQTTNPHIFLAGEGCSRPWLDDEAAAATAAIAVANALRRRPAWLARLCGSAGPAWLGRTRFEPERMPRALALDPQVIEIGLPAHALTDAARPLRWLRAELSPPASQMADCPRPGLLKVAVEPRSGRVVAVTAVARDAALWIAPLMLLMARRLPIAALTDLVPCGSPRVAALKCLVLDSQLPTPTSQLPTHDPRPT